MENNKLSNNEDINLGPWNLIKGLPPFENTLYDGQSLDAGEDIVHDAQGGGASNM